MRLEEVKRALIDKVKRERVCAELIGVLEASLRKAVRGLCLLRQHCYLHIVFRMPQAVNQGGSGCANSTDIQILGYLLDGCQATTAIATGAMTAVATNANTAHTRACASAPVMDGTNATMGKIGFPPKEVDLTDPHTW